MLSAICSPFSISIHAPREGCDSRETFGGANDLISIHAPREGCDYCICRDNPSIYISIHAPREGCDLFKIRVEKTLIDFNPRTP